jgi:hypothetical protein
MKQFSLLALAGLIVVNTVHAGLVRETFANDPALDGWQAYGDTNLFHWNPTNHVLDVTWDSTQANSYFYHPLGKTYTKADGFYLRFDLQLNDAVAFNGGSQLSIGLLHYVDATNSGFSRANFTSTNLCEFDYFPQFTYGTTVYPDSVEASVIDATGFGLFFASDNVTLTSNVTYRVELIHQPGAGSVTCTVSTNGQVISSLPNTYGSVGDFQLDLLSVSSYSDDGFGDSILAHGSVGNLAFASPLPVDVVQTTPARQWRVASDTNWLYSLEQTMDFQNWTTAAPVTFGNGTNLLLQATNPPAGRAFYRVRADLP